MARRSRRSEQSDGRDRQRIASSRAAPSVYEFDESWLRNYAERTRNPYIDLTHYEDRRRWSPSTIEKWGRPETRVPGLRARIVIVPEGHRLAKRATYNQRVALYDVLRGGRQGKSPSNRYIRNLGARWETAQWEYGNVRTNRIKDVSSRIGFALPWQVIICVRRNRRKQVLFAHGKTGAGRPRQRKPRRNFYSEVRC